MRITSETMVASSLRRLSSRLGRYERAQSQLASGKRILKPSDDPAAANRGLGLRAAQRLHEQVERNAADAKSWLDTTDSQLQSASDRLQRARDLAVRAASSLDARERGAIAEEIVGIRDELVGIANTTSRGRPLFSGYGADAPVRREADGSWSYAGDAGEVQRRVGEQDVVTVNVTAKQVFGFGGAGTDVFSMLDGYVSTLRDPAPTPAALTAGLSGIDGALHRLGDAQVRVGAASNRVDSGLRRSADALLTIRGELAQVEDVDVAAAVMELQTQDIAYQATLGALGKALPPTLLSFLR